MNKKIILCVIAMAIIGLFVSNICLGSDGFWKTSFDEIVGLLMLLFVSYYLVQQEGERRRKNDMIIKIIEQIQAKINQDDFLCDKSNITLMNIRNIRNKMTHIEEFIKDKDGESVAYIMQEIKELHETYSENLNEGNNISETLRRHISNIDAKCSKLILELC